MLLLLLACHVETDLTCETEVREVDDDEVLGELGFTVADLFADVGGSRSVDMVLADGGSSTAILDITRGEAPAVFADREMVEGKPRWAPGIYTDHNLVFVECGDHVQVPFDVAFTAPYTDWVAEGAALLRSERGQSRVAGVGNVSLTATFDGDVLLPEEAGAADEGLRGSFDSSHLARLAVQADGETLAEYVAR